MISKWLQQEKCYVSEFTGFMNDYLKQHPTEAQGQLDGRALLWDKAPLDLDERTRFAAAGVKQKPYVYQAD